MKLRLVSPLAAALGLAWTSSVLLLLASPTTDAAKISKFGHLHKRRAGSFEKDGVRDGRYAVNDHDFRGRRLNIFEHCPTVKTAKSSKSTTPTLCQCVACCEGMSILQTFVGIIYREKWRDKMISFFHLQDMYRLVYLCEFVFIIRICLVLSSKIFASYQSFQVSLIQDMGRDLCSRTTSVLLSVLQRIVQSCVECYVSSLPFHLLLRL